MMIILFSVSVLCGIGMCLVTVMKERKRRAAWIRNEEGFDVNEERHRIRTVSEINVSNVEEISEVHLDLTA